jgi:hypothetical protein
LERESSTARKMPVKSAKQFKLMEAAAHGSSNLASPSKSVAEDFLSKTPHSVKSKFAKESKFNKALRKRKP